MVLRPSRVLGVALLMITWVAGAAPASGAVTGDPVLVPTLPLDAAIPQTDIRDLGGGQQRNNNQRNFWWNTRAQRWDGILPTASPPADNPSQWWFWHDLGGDDPRPIRPAEPIAARTPDAYWDAGSETLFVFFSRGNSGTSRFRRYRYVQAVDRYIEVSAPGGVAAPAMLRGGSRVTIIRSPNGHLWAGVNAGNTVLVSRSTDDGDTWAEPVALKPTAISGEGHWVHLRVAGADHVGFAATENGTAPGGEAKVHFLHIHQDASDWHQPDRWIDESDRLPAWEGDERADDELSAVTFEDRAFLVIETEPLGDARARRRPQLVVFERTAGGRWVKHVIRRYTGAGAEDAKRPVVTVDASARLLVVTAGTTQRTHGDLWYAPIDSLTGRDEAWEQLRIFAVTDASTQNVYSTRMPLPRHPVGPDANLLIMIDNRGEARDLWRQVVRAERGGLPPSASEPPGPEPERPPLEPEPPRPGEAPDLLDGASSARLSGPDRFATAAAAALQLWPRGAPTVLLATGSDYPDALAGGPYAAVRRAPLLLTAGDALPPVVLDALLTLRPEEVVLLGGPAVLSAELEAALRALPGSPLVTRLAGGNRFETAARIAEASGRGRTDEVVVATGLDYPDAVAAGALTAGGSPAPVLLATTDRLLTDVHARERVLLVGGSGALSAQLEDAARSQAREVQRLAGPERFATSQAVADFTLRTRVTGRVPLVVATGQNFPDALAAGSVAARTGGPLLLVPRDGPTQAQAAWVQGHRHRFSGVVVVGGTSAVSTAAATRLEELLSDGAPAVPSTPSGGSSGDRR